MITSVLIANRGEIARRIIRTSRRLGIRTVAVFSTADADAPHVREADAAICIGGASPTESYLRVDRLLEAAASQQVEAIHPGYGFLSENAEFAESVVEAGKLWVGATPASIRAMGLKDAAKRLMASAGVPVTPGYLGDDQDPEILACEAAKLGWPVLIKAVAGGGGKGMRKVESKADFAAALAGAQREAVAAFSDGTVLLEKYVNRPRHIEVQVFGDAHGNVVHLFERDCSIQRRHQKIIEEAPAPGMDPETRQALCDAAVRAARAVNYQGAGTVEFIADASDGLRADRIWFMEMNTRLQVEHPVTEAVTGLDLVEWQFRVASGFPLPRAQDQISLSGHAIEARLYAEDPANAFLPSTGSLAIFKLPTAVRLDSAVEEGSQVTSFYDPMLAKLISHGETRHDAAQVLALACARVRVWPVKTNAWFLARCLRDPAFLSGEADTGFVEREGAGLTASPEPSSGALATAVAVDALAPNLTVHPGSGSPIGPWTGGLFGFQTNRRPASAQRFYLGPSPVDAIIERVTQGAPLVRVALANTEGPVTVRTDGDSHVCGTGRFHVHAVGGGARVVFEEGAAFTLSRSAPLSDGDVGASDGAVRSPMPGRIVAVAAKAGERVRKGQTLITLEAMKMEHVLLAPCDGAIVEVAFDVGDQAPEGAVLVRLEPNPL